MPKLTVTSLRTYRPKEKRREIADGTSGLFLIIQAKPSRTMSWALRFRRPDGRPAKMTLGRVDLSDEPSDAPVIGGSLTLGQARELAAKINRDRARGIDVIEERKAEHRRQSVTAAEAAANTFGALLPEFFIDHRTKKHIRPRHWREDARLLGLDYPRDCDPFQTEPRVIPGSVADRWRDKPISTIDGHLVHTVVEEARKFGIPGLARNNRRDGINENRGRKMYAALSVFFAWTLRKRKVSTDPTAGVWHPGAPPARERFLSEDERRWFWKACEQIGAPYGPLFKLLLLTGQRLGEVAGMRRGELSEDSQWVLPGARTKNHREHLVPLPPPARDIIASLPRIESAAGLVFTIGGVRLTGFSRAKSKLDAAMLAVARSENPAITLSHWTLHDLRRTAATGMADLGVQPHIVEAVLNHVSGHRAGVAGTYNRAAYVNEKKAALERWAAHLEALASGRSSNVVAFPAGAS
jgi:integrase